MSHAERHARTKRRTTHRLDRTPASPLNGRVTEILASLAATIAARRSGDPASSYVAKLLAGGPPLAARKLGEEAVETLVAALSGNASDLTAEAADLLFHLLVLLEARDVPFADVLAELDRREGVSGIDEKAARKA
jgi:phosphoribosyl-ATP pyrophosphohydrolase